MSPPREVHFYLHDTLRKRVLARDHNFINKLSDVLEAADFSVKVVSDSLSEKLKAKTRSGYSIVLMDEPIDALGLTIRLTYFYPFWHIEKYHERWLWPVAHAPFQGAECPEEEVKRFTSFWRNKIFGKTVPRRDGFVYIPLQGKLNRHRSFQYCSPIEMIEHVLAQDPDRQIIATLHPKETYTDAERDALTQLTARHSRFRVEAGSSKLFLPRCDYVVTQNSAVALSGYFLHKPAVLFGKIDFHHIAANVFDLGVEHAMKGAAQMAPDFDSYLWWFLQKMAINAGRPEADSKIEAVLRSHGWPI